MHFPIPDGGSVFICLSGIGVKKSSGDISLSTPNCPAGSSGVSGDISLTTGGTTYGTSGSIQLKTGDGNSGVGGDIVLKVGALALMARVVRFRSRAGTTSEASESCCFGR